MSRNKRISFYLLLVVLFLSATPAAAQVSNAGLLDDVLGRDQTATSAWQGHITTVATRLYWSLVVISMVWTFGIMAVRKAELNEFFAEFIRFIVTTGFFFWLLTNGSYFATTIFDSLREVAGTASGFGSSYTPSGIMDIGFFIFDRAAEQTSRFSPVDSAIGMLLAAAILVLLALVAVNMLLLLCAAWILAFGAIFFLGFGGSRWTSDIAINYFKSVLGLGAQLMALVFVVGVGKSFLEEYFSNMSEGLTMNEMAVMLVVTVILYVLSNKIPPMFAGIVSGHSPGQVSSYGAGTALAAGGAALAAAAVGAAAISSGMANAAGSAQAMKSAFSKGSENVESGSDLLSNLGGSSSGSDSSAGSFAEASGIGGNDTSTGSDAGAFTGSDAGASSGSARNLSPVSKAALVTADAASNIVKAGSSMAMNKARSRVSETLGGKMAQQIRAEGGNDEVAEFVGRSD